MFILLYSTNTCLVYMLFLRTVLFLLRFEKKKKTSIVLLLFILTAGKKNKVWKVKYQIKFILYLIHEKERLLAGAHCDELHIASIGYCCAITGL